MEKPLKWTGLALAASLLAAGCGESTRSGGAGVGPVATGRLATPSAVSGGPEFVAPPPVTVRYFDRQIELAPWSYCYDRGCADGIPPTDPPDVGGPEQVLVEFPLPGWSFTASFTPAGERCGRVQEVPLEETGDGEFLLRPAGYAGPYDVMLFGQGNGDLAVTFRWNTPTDGPLPVPEARLAVLADHDGEVDSYGVELSLTNLAQTPNEASATITVRARNGEEITFEATRARSKCVPEGSVYWDEPDRQGLAAAALGDSPFTYGVDLSLDGARYSATVTWPDDEIPGNEPSVPLLFTPELPALS